MSERCPNQNHSKFNVNIRFCIACGEVVNKNIAPNKRCSQEDHAKRRKDRNTFCSDCGVKL